MARFRRQGGAATAFCRAERVSTATFYKWKSRLAGDDRDLDFVEVEPFARSGVECGVALEVAGVTVRVGRGFDPEVLGAVLDVVKGGA